MDTKKYNILLILTGGTICSFADENGEREADTERALTLIVKNFRNGSCAYRDKSVVDFDPHMPIDILSENMTTVHWNTLLSALKTYDFSRYDGVIILHGTDTLAYTAALLSILMAGTKIPILLVSSQLPIYMDESNGNANFRAAVELIVNGIKPNVYAVYRNGGADGEGMYLHYGAQLLQCANYSDNFFSKDMTLLEGYEAKAEGKSCGDGEMLLYNYGRLEPCILRIQPYAGINYAFFALDQVKAVLHGTYHSSTMSVNPYEKFEGVWDEDSPHSILYLKKRCDSRQEPIPIFAEPCNEAAYAYETTGIALRRGVRALDGMTSEMMYVKLLVGCAMRLSGDELEAFVKKEINGEKLL